MTTSALPDCDLSKLAPDDLVRVLRWVEDRMINAIAPLDMRLSLEPPGAMDCDKTLQAGKRACARVMEHIAELRRLAGEGSHPSSVGHQG